MPSVSIGDAEIYYEEAGQGEPLLLVPGLSGQGSFWGQQVEAFKHDFRVIVHDHRGAGRSTHSQIKYSIEQMADDEGKRLVTAAQRSGRVAMTGFNWRAEPVGERRSDADIAMPGMPRPSDRARSLLLH